MTATDRHFHIYILASHSRRLYTGVTSQIAQRMQQHKEGQGSGFAARYNIDRLVYVEEAPDARSAIEREKQIKAWGRGKKIALIEAMNPGWADLAERWFATPENQRSGTEPLVASGKDSSLRSESYMGGLRLAHKRMKVEHSGRLRLSRAVSFGDSARSSAATGTFKAMTGGQAQAAARSRPWART